jgi:glycosyltransferase involved in cell wall biosynthesis
VRPTFQVDRIASIDTIDMLPPALQRIPFLLQSATFGWRALARTAVGRHAGVLVRDHYTLASLVNGLRNRDLCRLAAEVHNLPTSAPRRRWVVAPMSHLPAVITITDALKEDLVSEGLEPESILVARDGVHLHRHQGLPSPGEARRHLGLPPDIPTVVYAGQLYPWKGVDILVEAVSRLPDVRLLIVGGDSNNLPRVVGLADRLMPGRATFAGPIRHADVPFHLAAGDIIALPNTGTELISSRYTSPLKLFEAMATHRPVLASDIPSLREVLVHGCNAHLVAPDDPEAMAEGIAALLGNPERSARLKDQALRDVEPYDWAHRGQRVASFLRERLAVGGAR